MDEQVDEKELLYRWRDAVLSEHGPPPTTRQVLTVLSLHMDPDGGNCYPSTRLLAEETGLHRRTVMRRLEEAEEDGWVQREERGKGGRGWRRHQYFPAIPDVVTESHRVDTGGGDRESPPPEKRGDSEYGDVVTESHLSSSVKSPDEDAAPAPGNFSDLLPGLPAAVEILTGMEHPGGAGSTVATLNRRFLYDEDATMADPSVRGRPLTERRKLVATALLEMQDQGSAKRWNSRALAGFIRGLIRSDSGIGDGDWADKLEHKGRWE